MQVICVQPLLTSTRSPRWMITRKNCWSTRPLNGIRWIRPTTPPSC